MYLFLIHLPLISLNRSFSKLCLTLLNTENHLDFYITPRFSEIRPYILLLSKCSLSLQLPPELATKIISWRYFITFSLSSMLPFHKTWKFPKIEKIIAIKYVHHGWINGDAWIPITIFSQSLHTLLKINHFYIFFQYLQSFNLLFSNFYQLTFDMNCSIKWLKSIKISRMSELSF